MFKPRTFPPVSAALEAEYTDLLAHVPNALHAAVLARSHQAALLLSAEMLDALRFRWLSLPNPLRLRLKDDLFHRYGIGWSQVSLMPCPSVIYQGQRKEGLLILDLSAYTPA